MGLFMNGYKIDESPGALVLNGDVGSINKVDYNGTIIWDTKIVQKIPSITGIHNTYDMCETYEYLFVTTNNNLSVNVYRKSSSGDGTLSLERTMYIGAEVVGVHSYTGVTGYPGQPVVIITRDNVYVYSTYDFSLGTTLSSLGTFSGACAMSNRTLVLGQKDYTGSIMSEGRVLVYDFTSHNYYYINNPSPSSSNRFFGQNLAISAAAPTSTILNSFTQVVVVSERGVYFYTSPYVATSVPVTYSMTTSTDILGIAIQKSNGLQQLPGISMFVITDPSEIRHIKSTYGGTPSSNTYTIPLGSRGYNGGMSSFIPVSEYVGYLVFQSVTINSIGNYIRSTDVYSINTTAVTISKVVSLPDPYMYGNVLPFNTIVSKYNSNGLYIYVSATKPSPTFGREIFLYKI